MNLHGWEIDIDSLPGPQRVEWPWMHDELFEDKNGDIACLIYSIAEASMSWYVGRIAILKNKQNPIVILNPNTLWCDATKDMVQFGETNDYILIKIYAYSKETNELHVPISIIDLNNRMFSLISLINGCHYSLVDIGEKKVRLKDNNFDHRFETRDGKIIDLLNLEWFSLNEIDNFISIYFKEKSRNSV